MARYAPAGVKPYELSPQAVQDLFEIWQFIAQDSEDAANRVRRRFDEIFASLARMPRQGHRRPDATKKPFLFFPLYSYLIVYYPEGRPLQIVAVLHGARNLKRVLKARGL